MSKSIFIYILLFLIFGNIKSGEYIEIDNNDKEIKYNNNNYLNIYKVPISMMDIKTNGGELYNHYLKFAFDDDLDTYWQSIEKQTDNFLNNIQITFSKTITFDRILFKSPIINDIAGVGYPELLNIYYKLKNPDGTINEDDSDYLLIDSIFSESTSNKVIFILNEKVTCDQIKLEWSIIEKSTTTFLSALSSEIMILIPEDENLNILTNVFQENDYTHLNINKEYTNNKINEIEEKLYDYYNIYDHIKEIIDRIKKIIKGELKYETRREFTTNPNAKKNKINQYGNIRNYSRNILKMTRGGTNRQSTGIYGFSGDDIIVYVYTEKDDDPLPSIIFSQYIGSSKNFLSSPFKLK